MKRLIGISAAVLLIAMGVRAYGDYSATQGSGLTIFSFTCFSTKVCTTATPVNSAGTEIGTAAAPIQVSVANTGANATPVKVDNSGVTQPVSGTITANLGTLNGTATAANQATEIASLATIATNTGAAIPAGTANIGSVNTVTTNNSATQPHVCGSHIFKHITSGTDTQVLAASGSTTIYVCDYDISFGGAQTLFLEKSTSGTCASPTQIAQAWYGIANAGKIAANAYYRGLNTGASAQLCANTSGVFSGSGADLTVYFDQY